MVAELGLTVIPLDSQTAKTVQVGDTLKVEIAIRNTATAVLRRYRVMVVDRINELVACKEL